MKSQRVGVLVAAIALLAACAGNSSEVEGSLTTETTIETSIETSTTTEPETVLMLSEVLAFIEVSVRIGAGEEAEVVALAVDAETLGRIELSPPPEAPAWCSGASTDLNDTDRVERFFILLKEPAIDATLGGAERFELTATDAALDDEISVARILLVVGGNRFEVTEGELDLGETFTSGTFRGRTADGTLIEGAFLCG
jgi:hypothetical protein